LQFKHETRDFAERLDRAIYYAGHHTDDAFDSKAGAGAHTDRHLCRRPPQ
jgi:hypothetical protein